MKKNSTHGFVHAIHKIWTNARAVEVVGEAAGLFSVCLSGVWRPPAAQCGIPGTAIRPHPLA